MDGTRAKIGVFASNTRYSLFVRILQAGGIISDGDDDRLVHPEGFPARPRWAEALRAWERDGVDIAVVDDESFMDKAAMLSGLSRFALMQRTSGGGLHIIFVADLRRRADDAAFVRLASAGISDVVSPANDEPMAVQLVRAVLLAEGGSGVPEGAQADSKAQAQADRKSVV